MTFRFVYSEVVLIWQYRKSFPNDLIFFIEFHPLWRKTTDIDPETGYVGVELKNRQKSFHSIDSFLAWLKRTRGI